MVIVKNGSNNLNNYENYGLVFSNSAVLIDNCTFLMNNGNEIGGAVFFNNTFNFEIMNSKFVENSSPLGSAVSFLFSLKDFQNQLLMIKIHHNEFLLSFPNQNQNDSRFDLFYINFGPYHQYFCQNNSFNENVNEIVDFNLTCASLTFLENSSFSLKITHLAGLSLNTVIVYLSILDLQITPIIFNNSFFNKHTSTISKIIYYDPDATLLPTFKSPFNISVQGIHVPNSSSLITLRMSQCLLGEIFIPDLQICKKCEPGTASLDFNGNECHMCPSGAECYQGGFNITVIKGYWRESRLSYNLYACEAGLDSCLGGLDSICAKGYWGPKCQACDIGNGFMLSFQKGCKKCGENDVSSLFFILIQVAIFLFEAYYMYSAYVMNKLYCEEELKDSFSHDYMEEKKRTCMYFRVLTLYL